MARRTRKRSSRNGPKTIVYKQGRPSRNPRGSMGGPRGHKTFDIAHALINPFSPRSRGVKIPDDDGSRSVPITVVNRYTHVVGAGRQVVCVQPILNANTITSSSTLSGGNVTVWDTAGASGVADYAALATSFSQYRIVSWGVKVTPLAAPTAQSGLIEIQTNARSPVGSVYSLTSSFYEEIQVHPIVGSDAHWVSKPQGTTWKEYKLMTDVHDWSNVVFYFNGYPNGESIMFEVVFNLECQVALSNVTGAIATPAGDHNPHALALADHSRNRMSNAHPSHSSFLGNLKSAMISGLRTAANMAMPVAGRLLTNAFMPAQQYPRIMDVD